jgi:biotin transport system substrate-specific component
MYRSQLSLTGNNIFDDAVFTLLAVIAMSLLGDITFDDADNIPITLQSLLVVFFGLLFGLRIGVASVIIYLLVGGLGLPVFLNGDSGLIPFEGTRGGFLLAFPIGALIAGAASEWAATTDFSKRFSFITGAVILLLSQSVILLLGSIWANALRPNTLLIEDYIPGLLVKTALGTILFVIFGRILYRSTKH